MVGRIVFPGISVTLFSNHGAAVEKDYAYQKILSKQRKYGNSQRANPTFYILRHSLLINSLILLSDKKQPKGTKMTCNNIRNLGFF